MAYGPGGMEKPLTLISTVSPKRADRPVAFPEPARLGGVHTHTLPRRSGIGHEGHQRAA